MHDEVYKVADLWRFIHFYLTFLVHEKKHMVLLCTEKASLT